MTVGAGSDCGGIRILNELVRKPLINCLTAGHVGRTRHHMRDYCVRESGFAPVNFHLHFVPGILSGCLISELIRVKSAPEVGDALVYHYDTGWVYLNGIAGAHDEASA